MSEFTDTNADQVHVFALQMSNLGLSRVADLLVAMFESGVWREFRDGTGTYRFLPGEFDYFLTQQGVSRDLVLHGVRDVQVKARLEEAMDERRTGEDGYRRKLAEVRSQVPERPGSPIQPFGYTTAEGTYLKTTDGRRGAAHREPLGRAARQYRLTGGATTRRPAERGGRLERIRGQIGHLSADELQELAEAITEERRRRDAH